MILSLISMLVILCFVCIMMHIVIPVDKTKTSPGRQLWGNKADWSLYLGMLWIQEKKKLFTFVLQVEPCETNRSITPKSQMHVVWTAFYPLWKLAILKAPNQWTITVWSIINIKKIIIWFYTETVGRKKKKETLDNISFV